MKDSFFRVVFTYDYMESPNGKPSYVRTGIGQLFFQALVMPSLSVIYKTIHSKRNSLPASAEKFLVVGRELLSKGDLTGREDFIILDDEHEEEA
jgi:hypothetical protein